MEIQTSNSTRYFVHAVLAKDGGIFNANNLGQAACHRGGRRHFLHVVFLKKRNVCADAALAAVVFCADLYTGYSILWINLWISCGIQGSYAQIEKGSAKFVDK